MTAPVALAVQGVRRGARRPRRIRVPVQRQRGATDCGRTCLAMVLTHYGRATSSERLAERLPEGRDGHSALALIDAARAEGLEAEGYKLGAEAVPELAPGSILHWRGKHFVVYEGIVGRRRGDPEFLIVDPARGRCRISVEELERGFAGIAVGARPGREFVKRGPAEARWSRYLSPLAERRGLLATTIGLSLLLTALSLAVPLITAALVDRVIPDARVDLLSAVVLGGLGLVFAQAAFTTGRGLVLVRLHERFDRHVVHALVRSLLALPYAFFQNRAVGDLVMRFSSAAQVREAMTQGAISAFVDGALVIGYLAILAVFSPAMAGLAASLAGLQVAVFGLGRRRTRTLTDAYLAAEAESRGYQTRMLLGVQTLKATGSEAEAEDRFRALFEGVLTAGRARGRLAAWLDGGGAGLRTLGPLALLGVGAYEVMRGSMSLGEMLGASQLALGFLIPVAALVATATRLQIALSHVDRLEEIHEAAPEQDGGPRPAAGRTLDGGILLREVSFRYAPTSEPALREISLEVAPGQHIAIVGPSGSGKSTLARVLLGLSPASEGEVCFDGHPLADYDLRALRRQLGVVEQEARLFDMTVADNIALGTPGTTREAVRRAAALARIDGEIAALPMGYDTRLSDGGSALSGGQRQRLALARALVRRPRLLLLDEATSALDTITESAIQAALDELSCTIVTIAHRMSTVRAADVIVVMEAGRIVERGTHAELLARGGRYRELVDAQLS